MPVASRSVSTAEYVPHRPPDVVGHLLDLSVHLRADLLDEVVDLGLEILDGNAALSDKVHSAENADFSSRSVRRGKSKRSPVRIISARKATSKERKNYEEG